MGASQREIIISEAPFLCIMPKMTEASKKNGGGMKLEAKAYKIS